MLTACAPKVSTGTCGAASPGRAAANTSSPKIEWDKERMEILLAFILHKYPKGYQARALPWPVSGGSMRHHLQHAVNQHRQPQRLQHHQGHRLPAHAQNVIEV